MSDLDDFVELCIEADRRCSELRVKLVTGEVSWEDAAREYAKATAPLASAVAAWREAQNQESKP